MLIIEILYLINILASILLLIAPAWYSKKYLRLPTFNPITLSLIVFFPFQIMKILIGPVYSIEGGVLNYSYQYALLMNNIFYTCELASIVFIFALLKKNQIENISFLKYSKVSINNIKLTMWFSLIIYAISMTIVMGSNFGILNWIANPREGYQLYRSGNGHLFAIAISALSVSLSCSFLSSQNPRSVIKRFIPFMFLAYFFGSKTILLTFFCSQLIFLWFLKWKRLNLSLILLTPAIFSILLWNFYLAVGDDFNIGSVIEYFDYYKNASMYYSDVLDSKVSLFYGEIFTSSFWSYVPRSLYPDKPYVYGVLHINEIYFPGYAEISHTPAFGGVVEQYADFGVAGVIFFGLFNLNAFFYALTTYIIFYKPRINFHNNIYTIIAFIILLGPNFGTFFSGFTYFMLVILLFLISKIFSIKMKV